MTHRCRRRRIIKEAIRVISETNRKLHKINYSSVSTTTLFFRTPKYLVIYIFNRQLIYTKNWPSQFYLFSNPLRCKILNKKIWIPRCVSSVLIEERWRYNAISGRRQLPRDVNPVFVRFFFECVNRLETVVNNDFRELPQKGLAELYGIRWLPIGLQRNGHFSR